MKPLPRDTFLLVLDHLLAEVKAPTFQQEFTAAVKRQDPAGTWRAFTRARNRAVRAAGLDPMLALAMQPSGELYQDDPQVQGLALNITHEIQSIGCG